ncbi:hypothetical protein ACFWOL_07610 [Streptomyces sp. NPDC058442]|uniref:hypothetical protein n=1 Tax=Streptomyces sp. NPDC058442 TaxID=3346503 RepID=UPI003667E4E0
MSVSRRGTPAVRAGASPTPRPAAAAAPATAVHHSTADHPGRFSISLEQGQVECIRQHAERAGMDVSAHLTALAPTEEAHVVAV